MSRLLTIEVDDVAYETLRHRSESSGKTPAQWLSEAVARQLQDSPASMDPACSARQEFELLIGAVDLGAPTGAQNERIDEDLAREHAATHGGA